MLGLRRRKQCLAVVVMDARCIEHTVSGWQRLMQILDLTERLCALDTGKNVTACNMAIS